MNDVNQTRRKILTAATSLTAGVGIVGLSIPFVQSWNPSAKARVAGAAVEVETSKIEPGRMITVKWRGKPIWILRRPKSILEDLAKSDHREYLRDPDSETISQQPDYARNEFRSIRPEILVVIGICTHLGCIPKYLPEGREDFSRSLYFCPCHGSKFDLAGRVFKGVPAPTNLVIPPHQYLSENVVIIGVDKDTGQAS